MKILFLCGNLTETWVIHFGMGELHPDALVIRQLYQVVNRPFLQEF